MPREVVDFRDYIQRAIRCKVEGVGALLLLAVNASGRLHAENGLHIPGSRRICAAGQQHNGRPLRHSYAGCKAAAGQGDSVFVIGNGVLNFFQRLVVGFLFVAGSSDIGNFELLKHRVPFQQFAQSRRCIYARHNPERVPEHITVRGI